MNPSALKDFIIGSSYFITLIPFIYIGGPYNEGRTLEGITFQEIALTLPIYYGVMNVILKRIISKYTENTNIRLLMTGAITGFVLSLIGRFVFNAPELLFNMDKDKHMVHIIAPILYSLIFYISVGFLEQYL